VIAQNQVCRTGFKHTADLLVHRSASASRIHFARNGDVIPRPYFQLARVYEIGMIGWTKEFIPPKTARQSP
jgi:hypothetical protein